MAVRAATVLAGQWQGAIPHGGARWPLATACPSVREMTTRVVVAEDSALMREGMRLLVETQPDLALVGTCGDLDGLLKDARRLEPDVVITDIRMPPSHTDEGIRAAQALRESNPGMGVLVLSQYADIEFARSLFANGAQRRGYLLKERVGDVETLFHAVRTIVAGESVMDPSLVDMLMSPIRTSSVLQRLSPREREVLGWMAQGMSNAAIGQHVHLTERAVEKVINSLFTKLDLANESALNRRVMAVRLFIGLEGL
jgi:DNA-binding NarL/FixJ family response regulator